ncbi:amino acid ABC transporter permease [Ornithinimicrobium sp. LYQ92]|uniref:amino acid ABC transporter permease n=1 Tax=Serinicoccus sp. LYQ92 TaxID=3378798 RepID=UPI00385369EC
MSSSNVLFDVPGPKALRRHMIFSVVAAVVMLGGLGYVVLVLWNQDQITASQWAPMLTAEAWTQYVLPGVRATVVAAFFSIIIAFVLGLVAAMGRMSELLPLRWVATLFIEFFRAVPVLIMMIFALTFLTRYTGLEAGSRPLVAVIIGLVLYNSAVIAEVIRSGVGSLPAGQREGGLSIGLMPAQVRRAILVPQALTSMLPTLVSQIVVILKDTALGYIILYPELLNAARQMGSRYGNMTVALLVGAVLFITINWLVTTFAEWLEGRLRRRGRSAGPIGPAHDAIQTDGTPDAADAGGGPIGAVGSRGT